MARFDKYEPRSGGFRGKLEAAIAAGQVGTPLGVWINASGRVQVGGAAAATDIVGVVCAVRPMSAREPIDVMTGGEIADLTGFTAGARVYSGTDGALSTTNTGRLVGRVTDDLRLVVRTALG